MKTLIIYDDTGFILLTQSGDYRVPEGGVQYLEYEIPAGQYAINVDVEKKVPILIESPKTETEYLKEEIEALKNDIADLTLQMIMEV